MVYCVSVQFQGLKRLGLTDRKSAVCSQMEATACQRLSNPREPRPQWQPFVFTSMGKSLVIGKCSITSREMAGNTSVINFPIPPPSPDFVDKPSQSETLCFLPPPSIGERARHTTIRQNYCSHACLFSRGWKNDIVRITR